MKRALPVSLLSVVLLSLLCFGCASNPKPKDSIIYPEIYRDHITTFADYLALKPKLDNNQNISANLQWSADLEKFWTTKQGWRISVDIDKFTDKKIGFIQNKLFSGNCFLHIDYKEGVFWIQVGEHTHPGALGKVRIDSNDTILFTEAVFKNPYLINEMLAGKTGIAHYVKWPNEARDSTFSLEGFKEVFDIFTWLITLK